MRRVPPGAPILTADAMRRAEASAFARGVSQSELMARAGLAVAREVHRYVRGRAVLVLAGPGNNGGDAHVVARLLSEWGHDVMVATFGKAGAGAAAEARRQWTGATVPLAEASGRAVLVDCLFGTGLTRPIEGDIAARVEPFRESADMVVAIDVPSGVDSDRGVALGYAVRADVTVALGVLKPCHLLSEAAAHSGHVVLADLGIAVGSEWHTLARPERLRPNRDAHKFTRGLALVVGGAMAGASRLAASAALRAGAGYVVLATRDGERGSDNAIVAKMVSEAAELKSFIDERKPNALCIGPGLGRDARASALIDAALAADLALVLDGDALSVLGRDAARRVSERGALTILTPHGGEFERMFGASAASKIDRTLDAARETGAIIVHKGADTVMAHPDGRVIVSAAAPSMLATAGSGDVLAGLIAGRLATGGDPWAAVAAAAWLHMRAAELAGPGLVADDLIAHSAAAMQEVW